MRSLAVLIVLSLFASFSFSQTIASDSLSKEKIKELQFIIGEWQGSGWMMGQNGKSEFDQWENVQYKLDSTAILIEGLGKVNGKIIHNALAILTYNKADDNYDFTSFLQNGLSNKFEAEFIDNKFYWYPNANVRYVIWENDEGQWFETGEYKQGENWSQYFEMTLDRVK